MKKLLITGLLTVLFTGIIGVIASKTFANEANQVKVNNQVYTLKYSTNKTASGEYMNEYYKEGEQGFNWTELITVQEFPNNAMQPLEYAELIQSKDQSPDGYDQMLNRNRQLNTVTFIFLMRGRTDDYRYVEFNVMKVEPYKGKRGLRTMQYAKKYKYNNREEFLNALAEIDKEKNTIFNEMKNTLIPPVVHESIGE